MELCRNYGTNLQLEHHDLPTEQDGTRSCSGTAVIEDHLEVTHEQFLNSISNHAPKKAEINNNKGGLRRFTKLMGNRSFNLNREAAENSTGRNSQNIKYDENFDSNRSLNSAASYTVGSLETLKVSNASRMNRNDKIDSSKRRDKNKNRWNPLIRIIKVKTTPSDVNESFNVQQFQMRTERSIDDNIHSGRQRARTEDSRSGFLHGQRIRSTPGPLATSSNGNKNVDVLSHAVRDMVDDNIRGRFHGIDMLYLGDGRFTSSVAATVAPWDTPFAYTFTGQPPHWPPQRIVEEMLLSSSGRNTPEIILDGFMPGPDGRWIVQVDIPRENISIAANNTTTLQSKRLLDCSSDLSKSVDQPTHAVASRDEYNSDQSSLQLQQVIWGSEMPQIHLTDSRNDSDEDAIHVLASRCSIPIDTDNNSFLIGSKEHITAVHDVISVTLAKGQFADTCRILNFILRGIPTVTDPDLRYFRGALLHNLGIVQLWQEEEHLKAARSIQEAIHERQKSLPPKHPDIVASFVRKGDACFVVGDIKGAICALESALSLSSPEHLVRAIVLNNLGVAYYFDRGGKLALEEFMKSLAIQRSWLESTMRRETTVYYAAITLCNMGKVYLELAEFDLSLHAYEEAVLLLTSVFSKDHDMVLSCLSSLAVAKSQKGDLDHGLQILQGCLRSQNNRFGEMSTASIETVGLIGCLHAKKGEFGAAIKNLSIVRKWQKIHLSPQHHSSQKIKESIKLLENRLGIVRSPSVAKVWV